MLIKHSLSSKPTLIVCSKYRGEGGSHYLNLWGFNEDVQKIALEYVVPQDFGVWRIKYKKLKQ